MKKHTRSLQNREEIVDPRCCLSCAVHNGDIKKLRNILDNNGLSESQAWSVGHDLLTEASRSDGRKKFLLECGAKANSESKCKPEKPLYWNGAPLCQVVGTDIVEIMKSLLRTSRDVVRHKWDNYSGALRIAAQMNNTDITEILLDHLPRNEITPCCTNVMSNLETVKSLLWSSVDVDGKLHDGSKVFKIADQLINEATWKVLFSPLFCSEPPLYRAAEKNIPGTLKMLLQRNADIEERSHNDLTALHIAAQLGNTKSAKILLNHGARVSSVCALAMGSLLIAAVKNRNVAFVEWLLKRGANINTKSEDEGTLLDVAIARGCFEVAKLLLNCGADIMDVRDENHEKILGLAVAEHDLLLIERILQIHSDPENLMEKTQRKIHEDLVRYGFEFCYEDTMDCRLFDNAVREGCCKIVEHLLNLHTNYVNKSKVEGSAIHSLYLHTAVQYRQIEIARLLIKNKADVNAVDALGKTPLFYAIAYMDRNSADEKMKTQLHSFTRNGIEEIVKILLNEGASVNAWLSNGDTVFHHAIKWCHAKTVKIFIESGADIAGRNKDGATSLHIAAARDKLEIVEMLLSAFDDVDYRDGNGKTALHYAVEKGHTRIVKLLIKNGAGVAYRDNDGATLLHIAAAGKRRKIVDIFLNTLDDVDCRDAAGKTALHVAAMCGNVRIVRRLLDSDSDINLLCNCGKTAVNYAMSCKRFPWDDFDNDNWGNCSSDEEEEHTGIANDPDFIDIIFVHHIVKMIALNRFVSEKNLQDINDYGDNKIFYDPCKCEIECMRQKKIGLNGAVSYYDLLTKGMSRLAVYARNKDIVHTVETEDHKGMFPFYSAMLYHRFKKGKERAGGLLDSSLKSFRLLTGYPLPDSTIIELFDYLSNGDLKNLMKAGPCNDSDN